jgi:hypothetical protein
VQGICDDVEKVIAVSALTLIEFHNALASTWRNEQPAYQQYDQSWVQESSVEVMEFVASGRFMIIPNPPSAPDHAIALVRLATREFNNGLRAWDAVHLITATAWAYKLGFAVDLWTSDKDFGSFVDLFPHFKRFVSVVDINPS